MIYGIITVLFHFRVEGEDEHVFLSDDDDDDEEEGDDDVFDDDDSRDSYPLLGGGQKRGE